MPTPPAIKDKILVSKSTFYNNRTMQVSLKLSIAAATSWLYDTAATIGATEAAKYDLTQTEIQVYVLDSEVGSPTNGYYIDAGAIAAFGFKEDGSVKVVNQHDAALSFMIRVVLYRKPL